MDLSAYEPETKQQSDVWVFEPELNPMKIVCEKIASKQMMACFFCKTGHVATVRLDNSRRVNSEWYTTILSTVMQKNVKLSHVNVRFQLVTPERC